MGGEVRGRAVLLDAMGTLFRLEDPAPRLRSALAARLGVDVGAEAAGAAIRAEIGYYRAHLHHGRDADSLAALRTRCAEEMRPALPEPVARAPIAELTAALLDALAFSVYADAEPALRQLRSAGCALVVVSNWDCSLHERLEETGLAPLVDAAVASAVVGAAKPERAIFDHALALADAAAEDAWHAGDSMREDVEGARAAGIRAVLVARDEPPEARDRPRESTGPASPPRPSDPLGSSGPVGPSAAAGRGGPEAAAVPVLRSLEALPALVAGGEPYALRP
jgi:putative hydrolase of the HAD superfamily